MPANAKRSAAVLLAALACAQVDAAPKVEVKKTPDAVCEYVRTKLGRPQASTADLGDVSLTWTESGVDLPDEIAGASEAEFDFDNDGKLDRVYRRDFSDHYMTGSSLLVQPGGSAGTVEIESGGPVDDPHAAFLPCQWDAKSIALRSCPPFTQDNDEAGFAVARRGSHKPVFFRARYADLTPFRFQGRTFVAITSHSADSQDFTAIVQPLPEKRFEPKCLLRGGHLENTW